MRKISVDDIGSVYEVTVAGGRVYVQVTHVHPHWGPVVWVLPGIHGAKPDLASLVERDDGFFSLCPLAALVSEGNATRVGHLPVPTSRQEFPTFRDYLMTDRDGRGRDHQLWDGEKLWKVGNELTAEQKRLPLLRLPTTAAFVRRLGEGWTPERDEELLMEARRRKVSAGLSTPTGARTQHYMYFPREDSARSAARRVVEFGGAATVRASADNHNWLVLAVAPGQWNRDQADWEFQRIAKELGGNWDGAETRIA